MEFQTLKTAISGYYQGDRYKWLRCCLYDIVPGAELEKTNTGAYLFHALNLHGKISPTNVELLSEITELTCVQGAIDCVNKYIQDNKCKHSEVKTLTPYRRGLVKVLINAGKDEFKNVVGNYEELNPFKFQDFWDAVYKLEKSRLLADNPEKIQRFVNLLEESTKELFLGEIASPGAQQGMSLSYGLSPSSQGLLPEDRDVPETDPTKEYDTSLKELSVEGGSTIKSIKGQKSQVSVSHHSKVKKSIVQVTKVEPTDSSNMSSKIVNYLGETLVLKDSGIELRIPENAIHKEENIRIYIENILEDELPLTEPTEISTGPIVKCGPPDTEFKEPVTLSFPQSFVLDEKHWEFTGFIQKDTDPKNFWRQITEDDKDYRFYQASGRCWFEMKHFSKVRSTCKLKNTPYNRNRKPMKMQLFGKAFLNARIYQVRSLLWSKSNHKDCTQINFSEEKSLSAVHLFPCSSETMTVRVKTFSEGWTIETERVQAINHSLVCQYDMKMFLFKATTMPENLLNIQICACHGNDEIINIPCTGIDLGRLPEEGLKIEKYKMTSSPRGICLIINNMEFTAGSGLDERNGSEIDEENLKDVFTYLGFKVKIRRNKTAAEMLKTADKYRSKDHSKYDCFVCCILSHGDLGTVSGSDGELCKMIDITSLFRPKHCPTLASKPKLFFLQACQGSRDSEMFYLKKDYVHTTNDNIPDDADFLLGYATAPGNAAYRNEEGSLYITVLTESLKKYHDTHHILDILTHVNNKVSKVIVNDKFKQIPAPQYTLRGQVYFPKL